MDKRTRFAIIGIGAVVLLGVLVIFLLTDPGSGRGADGSGGGKDGSGSRFSFDLTSGGSDPKAILKEYKEYAIYPPTSRPLTRRMTDLLNPNSRYENFLPVGGPPAGKTEEEKRKNARKPEHYYLFTGDRYFVIGNDTINVHLRSASRASINADRVPISIEEASLHKGRGHLDFRSQKVADIRLNDQGLDGDKKAGDYIYSVSIAPAQLAAMAKYHGRAQIYAKFKVGDAVTEALIPFEYQPESETPGRFTGTFSDVLEDGSLVVYAGVDVFKPGYFTFDANLFDSQDVPVAYTRTKVELKTAGKHEVKLLFFGKVLRDKSPTPPFTVKNLRGFRNMLGIRPPKPSKKTDEMFKNRTTFKQILRPSEQNYTTRGNYQDLARFSNKEWESEQKRRKIQFLESEVDSGTKMPVRVGE